MAITIDQLTQADMDGSGVIDRLMKAVHNYVDHEFKLGRIKGPEYASVCLGLIEAAMKNGVDFLLNKDKAANEALLIQAQIALAEKQLLLADKDLELKDKEIDLAEKELDLKDKQIAIMAADLLLKDKELEIREAELALREAELPKIAAEIKVLEAQECKLRADYDYTMQNVLKAAQETALLTQKVVTERAQTQSMGVDSDSVIGRQKDLYAAQAAGFSRDAEQKAAKILVDSWNVRRTTNDSEPATTINKLDDSTIGAVISKMLNGIGI